MIISGLPALLGLNFYKDIVGGMNVYDGKKKIFKCVLSLFSILHCLKFGRSSFDFIFLAHPSADINLMGDRIKECWLIELLVLIIVSVIQ